MIPLSAESIQRIEHACGWRVHRIEVFDLPEGKVIVKGHRPKRSPWRYCLLNAIARLIRVPMVKAVPVHGGAQAQAVEIRRLRELHTAGLPVPKVIYVTKDYFVMSYLGESHLAAKLIEQRFAAFTLWREAVEQIVQVHAAGQYLSQCFARNIIVDYQAEGDRLAGVIDFEDDPLEVMSLLDAQVRDWLVFLQSTVYALAAPPNVLKATLLDLLQRESPDVRRAFLKCCEALAWLRFLPRSRRPLGKDTMMVQALAQAVHELLMDDKF